LGKKLYVAAAVLTLVIVVLIILSPSKDICSDEVRGYDDTANSSLDVARQNLSKIKATVSTELSVKVPVQLDGLNATNFAALKACDTQCKLLGQCLRFVFFKPPSEACPNEYKDYKERTDAALGLLSKLQGVAAASKQAAQKSEEVGRRRKDAAELENSSGSTGGRVDQLNDEIRQMQSDLSRDLSAVDQRINEVLRDQQKGT